MRFGILGPFEIVGADAPAPITGAKRRALLALLVVYRGRTLSNDRIVDLLWEDDASRGASGTVQTYVSQLRRLIRDSDATDLVTHPTGYSLEVGPASVDADRFEAELRTAAGQADLRERSAALGRALALWRGPPLEEFPYEWASIERTRLERLRLDALGDRVDMRLALGEQTIALDELELATTEHPFEERLWGQRMLAAYRAGRQAEALRIFQQVRERLRDELGIAPGPELVELERRILEQDPSLQLAPASMRRAALPTGVVTLLLTDIEKSTMLWDSQPDAMAEALTRHDALIASAIAENKGTLLKARGEGDSTFSVFSRATDAVAASLRLVEVLAAEVWPAAIDLRVRAAIYTGEAFERDGDYFGPTVNRAARLRALASGGETLVAESTARVVQDNLLEGVELVELGPRTLAGITRPELVYRLGRAGERPELRPTLAAPPAAWTAAPLPFPSFLVADEEPFVAREAEMDGLRAAWAAARAGTRRTVLIAGEPGIGKTTLVARIARVARDDGAAVLAGRCDEHFIVAYQPFAELLRGVVRHPEARRAVLGLRGRLSNELVRLVPEMQDLDPIVELPADTDADTARHRLFEAFEACLEALAERVPVVLVLEDLHWAAPPTLQMLRHIARSASGRLLILATYRDTEAEREPALGETLGELWRDRHFEHVQLGGMTLAEIAALLESAEPGSTELHPDAPTRLLTQTGGNPFFIGEVLRSGDRWTRGQGGARPSSVGLQELVARRLAQLSPASNRTLVRASIIGAEFDDRLLAASDDTLDRAALLDALGEAAKARLIVEATDARGNYRFAHAIVRDAIEASMTPGQQAVQHRVVAEALEKIDDERVDELSNHFWKALQLGCEAQTAFYARRAGDRAVRGLAFDEAAEHFTRVVAALERMGTLSSIDGCDVLLEVARAYVTAGNTTAAEDTIQQILVLARALHSSEHIARAALCFEGEIVTGLTAWEQRLAVLEEAHSIIDELDAALAARVLAMLAHVRAGLRPGPDVAELASTSIELAESAGDDVALAAALYSKLDVLSMPEHAEERASLAASVLARADAAGATALAMSARHMRLATLLELGKIDEYEAELSAYAAMAEAISRPHDLWRREVMRAGLALFRGELEEGSRRSRAAYSAGKRMQQPGALQGYFVHLFFVGWHRAELDSFVDAVVASADAARGVPAFRAALALTYAEVGRTDDACALIAELAAADFAAISRDNLWLGALSFLAHAAWVSGDPSCAAELERALEAHAGLNAIVGSAVGLGSASRPLALVQALQGKLDLAASNLERAIVANSGMDSLLWTATAQKDLADVLRLRGRPEDAQRADDEAARAIEIGTQLGARRITRESP